MNDHLENDNLEPLCRNCQAAHPSEPVESDFAICLNAPELEPFLDDILERQDFSRCQDLVERLRFPWGQEGCEEFDPVDLDSVELPPGLARKVEELADRGDLNAETFLRAFASYEFEQTDWSRASADQHVEALTAAGTHRERMKALAPFGFFIGHGNQAAFDALCQYLRALPPPTSPEDKAFRIALLGHLETARDHQREVADLLVQDLLRTPSNHTTRGWYTEVFNFLERRCSPEIVQDVLGPVADSPHFSVRRKKRIRALLQSSMEEGRHP